MIDEVYEDPEQLYEFYKTNKKLKLKGVKYFLELIPYKSLIEDLDFLKIKKNLEIFLEKNILRLMNLIFIKY